MKRAASIEALINRSREGLTELRQAYEASLHEKKVREDLKVDIKNIFENLRSCLDYVAHELHEFNCAPPIPSRLYFPIRQTLNDFAAVMQQDFPNLDVRNPSAHQFLESIQPFHNPWLSQFNELNNQNKHQDLVEQTRTESRQVSVTRPGAGSVSWQQSGVVFGSGVRVMGVPIDPKTQMPVPNTDVQTNVTTWVDFRFRESGASVIPFIEKSVNEVDRIYRELSKHC